MNKVFFCLAATVVLAAHATVAVAQVVLPPDQIMQPHLDSGEGIALWVAGAAGMVAVLSGLMNFYIVRWGHQPPEVAAPASASRRHQRAAGLPVTKPVIPSRYSIPQGVLFVVLGGISSGCRSSTSGRRCSRKPSSSSAKTCAATWATTR